MTLLGKNYETCKSCEVLKQQLEISNGEKAQLLDQLLNITKPKVYESITHEVDPIRPKVIPWHVRQKMLEQQSKENAAAMERVKKANEELEKEVLEDAN
jgi:hypothetical protein